MASISELINLVPPPPKHTRRVDWAKVGAQLGFELPADYRELVANYGPGVFDDFLGVLVPDAPIEYADIVIQQPEFKTGLRALKGVDPAAVPRGISDLTACAATSNGDVVYWIDNHSGNPNTWPIAISAPRDGLWEEYDGTLVGLLCSVFSHQYRSNIFPAAFPNPSGAQFVPFLD